MNSVSTPRASGDRARVSRVRGVLQRPAHTALFTMMLTCLAGSVSYSVDPVSAAESRPTAADAKAVAVDEQQIFIVGFVEEPLGRYRGGTPGLPAPARAANGRLRAPNGAAERQYLDHLDHAQNTRLTAASKRVGRELAAEMSFKHAFNGVVLKLTPEEAAAISQVEGVSIVEPYKEYVLDTDAGPGLLGAPGLWDGTNVPGGIGSRGEGVVVGIIDSGINFDSPSFAATEPGNANFPGGYAHVNPLGDGVFLGSCRPGSADAGLCNAKLIGAYDFVYTTQCNRAPPLTACANTVLEEPSVEDNNGHGSHTASTTAGNAVTAPFSGASVAISGVARHANIVAYDACYTRLPDGAGLCPNVSLLGSINQVVADGIIDVVNYSISGGNLPWNDTVSLGFLTAVNAGTVVVASAGNSGPGAATLGHLEPWVMTTAASTHSRSFAFDFDLTGPAGAPANTQNILVRPGGAPVTTTTFTNAPLIVSPNFGDPVNDGCVAYPANTFRRPATAAGVQGIAVLALANVGSACGSAARRTAALNAGASGTLFVVDAPANLGANNTSWQMDRIPDWNNVAAHLNTDPANATATITAPLAPFQNVIPDSLAGFSSRGPSGFDHLKPDIAAPGVNILAVLAGASTSYGLNSGTSMASPHAAGSSALIRALHPTWTPTEIKSAIMSTAKSVMQKEDNTTPSDPFDRGSGRVDLTRAARAGLVFNETGANFLAANPALGGDTSQLNLASLQNDSCVGNCAFPRTVRSTLSVGETYTLAATGLPAGAVTFSVPNITVAPGGTANFTVFVDSSLLTADVYSFGQVTLTPTDTNIPTQHMPIAVRPSPPRIQTTPADFFRSQATNTTTQSLVTITNVGNPTLDWDFVTGPKDTPIVDNPPTNSGFFNSFYTGLGIGQYVSDDFRLLATGSVKTLRANGFTLPSGTLGTAFSPVLRFFVYADDGGKPAGGPENFGAPAVWQFSAAPNAAGISVADNNISLDLAAAGAPALTLGAGTYWLVVAPDVVTAAGQSSPSWLWRIGSNLPAGNPPQSIVPASGGWSAVTAAGLSARIVSSVECGVPWATVDIPSGSLATGNSSNVQVFFNSTGLSDGLYSGYLCIESNDPGRALTTIPLQLTVGTSAGPSGIGAASPSTAGRGGNVVVSVAVTPGTNPTSTGIAVTANLSQLGGSATQPLNDSGLNGDVVAGDGTFAYRHTVGFSVNPGAYTVAATVADAQARTAAVSIPLTVATSTTPSGFGRATPASVLAGATSLLTVQATAGTGPASTGLNVRADLTAIGGSATQVFRDDGQQGDITANDNVFSFNAATGANTTAGAKTLVATIRDNESRSATANIALTVTTVNPSGTGLATPATVNKTGTSLLTVTVTPGSSPPSTGLGVSANLSSIGLATSQAFRNDGQQGDAVSGDNIWSFNATVPLAATPGAKMLPATITDAQARTGSTNIALTVATPTDPSVTAATATPATVSTGEPSVLAVTVANGTNPTSSGVAVTANLTGIGGSATQAFLDDGQNGDATAGDGTFSYRATAPHGTAPGAKSFAVSVVDAQARTAGGNIALTLATPTALAASGAATPANALPGASSLLTVSVTPGATPASTGVVVTGDLTSIGGSATQAFLDDGQNGDAAANDNVYSYNATIGVGTSSGPKSMPITVADAQTRTASTSIALNVPTAGAPTGQGFMSPSSATPGAAIVLAVAVTPGSNPPSTGLVVRVNLTALGGTATQLMYDDGTNGDQFAGDGVYSFAMTVPSNQPNGSLNVPVTISDAQLRTSSATIVVDIRVGELFSNGFE